MGWTRLSPVCYSVHLNTKGNWISSPDPSPHTTEAEPLPFAALRIPPRRKSESGLKAECFSPHKESSATSTVCWLKLSDSAEPSPTRRQGTRGCWEREGEGRLYNEASCCCGGILFWGGGGIWQYVNFRKVLTLWGKAPKETITNERRKRFRVSVLFSSWPRRWASAPVRGREKVRWALATPSPPVCPTGALRVLPWRAWGRGATRRSSCHRRSAQSLSPAGRSSQTRSALSAASGLWRRKPASAKSDRPRYRRLRRGKKKRVGDSV